MFKTEGVFRKVSCLLIPRLKAAVSANANSGLWQLVQDTEESFESIFSLNSNLPKVTALYSIGVLSIMEKPSTTNSIKVLINK